MNRFSSIIVPLVVVTLVFTMTMIPGVNHGAFGPAVALFGIMMLGILWKRFKGREVTGQLLAASRLSGICAGLMFFSHLFYSRPVRDVDAWNLGSQIVGVITSIIVLVLAVIHLWKARGPAGKGPFGRLLQHVRYLLPVVIMAGIAFINIFYPTQILGMKIMSSLSLPVRSLINEYAESKERFMSNATVSDTTATVRSKTGNTISWSCNEPTQLNDDTGQHPLNGYDTRVLENLCLITRKP